MADCLVMYARPDTAGFMGRQPDHVIIADLALPGTHDTCAYYGCESEVVLGSKIPGADSPDLLSQCQQRSTPLSQQLLDGEIFHLDPNICR